MAASSTTSEEEKKIQEQPLLIVRQPHGETIGGSNIYKPQPSPSPRIVSGLPLRAVDYMPRPSSMPGVPPGLEYLTQVDQLLVHQQIEILEALSGWETKNKYVVKNVMGQQVYFVAEESSRWARQCCKQTRGFKMHCIDNTGQVVMVIRREFKCAGGICCLACGDNCASDVAIEAPPGNIVGGVQQEFSCCAPTFRVYDERNKLVFRIIGPVCQCQNVCCSADLEFRILAQRDVQVGKITKQWGGYFREVLTDATHFGLVFPLDLDVRMKATLFGALFLIDFIYFEK